MHLRANFVSLASLPSHGPHKFSGSQRGGEKEGERDEEMEKKQEGEHGKEGAKSCPVTR